MGAIRVFGVAAMAVALSAQPRQLAQAQPETVGFSSGRLERLHAKLQQYVDDQQFAGIVTVLARRGKVVDFRAYGKRDLASGAGMERDAIFRIYSMTKPITGVAMMILYEQGKWSPSDPIAKYIPEFAHLQVFKGLDSEGKPILEDPAHAPTMAELMSHTAGFTYGIFGTTPVDKMYRDANVLSSASLQQMIGKLARLPLLFQPGTKWVYSVSTDIQGYLVEKLSGKPLGDFMRENIWQPLGMKDTAFHIAPEKAARLVTLYAADAAGRLAPTDGGDDFTREPTMPSGGGGLLSTAGDYLRFSQMLLNGGELDGVRILAPSSVALMRTNRLPSSITNSSQFGISFFRINPGFGFGFDFGVYTDPAFVSQPVGRGAYTWLGAAGTWFWIDPANETLFVGMVQRMIGPGSPDMNTLTQQSVYQALTNPEK
jgi:CubicO group peptidase (beta-lactamase class C family)